VKAPEHIAKVVNDLEKEISEIKGTVDVRNNSLKDAYEFSVDIDPDSVSSLGILKYDVQRQVNIALKGASRLFTERQGKSLILLLKAIFQVKKTLKILR
jgi:multidrug efflux pump